MSREAQDEPDRRFGIGSSIPVLRMLDEADTRAFYIDILGFAIDWEHRFEPESADSPLYMQVRLGDAVLHLDGHKDRDAPVTEVRIPVRRIEEFCADLRARWPGSDKPEAVDPRYEGRNTDLNLIDPSGNLLVFWLEGE